jgi:phytoene synthase
MTAQPPRTHLATPFPRPGTSLDYALASVPLARRPAVLQWLRWWHEVSQIPLTVSDPTVAETKLRWWQKEIQDASQGQPHHPLITGWPTEVTKPDWPLWQEQLASLLQLVNQTRWLDEASVLNHAEHSTGAACEGAATLLGASSAEAKLAARQLGVGLCLAHRLARLGQDARSGWVHVAIDVLQQHEVRAHELSKPAEQAPEGWPNLIAHLRQQASACLHEALSAIQALPKKEVKALRPLVVLAHIQLVQMAVIESSGNRILHERIVLTPLRKWWISQRVRWGWLR